jgi:hypothetical protein
LLLAAIIIASVAWFAWGMWRVSKPTTTIARMGDLMGVLQTEKPARLEADALKEILARNKRSECAVDGWGRPFIIEHIHGSGPGQGGFRITSLGSDGKRDPCCKRFVDRWEDDAVLEGDQWLQRWSFGRMPTDEQ